MEDSQGMSQQRKNLDDWIAFFGQADIPVLRLTNSRLQEIRAENASPSAASIADIVIDDPFMTVRLLRYMQAHKSRHQSYELVDVTQVLLMMGIESFFDKVCTSLTVEQLLRPYPEAQLNLLRTVRRSQRASYYAGEWALMLRDLHYQEVMVSALLSPLSELLMWCFNPLQMLEIRHRQTVNPGLRSDDVQRDVLGFSGVEMQRKLGVEWELPELLISLTDPARASLPRVRNVSLAVRLARHSSQGWNDAALPDDYTDIAGFLHMDVNAVAAMVKHGRGAVL